MIKKEGLTISIINIILLSMIILLVSYFFMNKKLVIGPILILLGIISLTPIFLLKIPFQTLKGDIIFGAIDNGILAIFALSGAEFFGILGALIGSLVGNAITDGFAGIFEGQEWQKVTKSKIKNKRTALTVALGKLAGCLLGAGLILTIVWTILKIG